MKRLEMCEIIKMNQFSIKKKYKKQIKNLIPER